MRFMPLQVWHFHTAHTLRSPSEMSFSPSTFSTFSFVFILQRFLSLFLNLQMTKDEEGRVISQERKTDVKTEVRVKKLILHHQEENTDGDDGDCTSRPTKGKERQTQHQLTEKRSK